MKTFPAIAGTFVLPAATCRKPEGPKQLKLALLLDAFALNSEAVALLIRSPLFLLILFSGF